MKRLSESSNDPRNKTPRRQDPISCQFCRSKKLRCDRQTPCSNCAGRRIPCVSALDGARKVRRSAKQDAQGPSIAPRSHGADQELLTRLRKLEDTVFSQGRHKTIYLGSAENNEYEITTEQCHNRHPRSPDDHSPDEDEDEDMERRRRSKRHRNSHLTEVASLHLDDSLFISQRMFDCNPLSVAEITRMMPTLEQARTLLEFYLDNINWAQHVLHVSTTRQQVETIYLDLSMARAPDNSHLVLVASLFAIAAYFWPAGGSSEFPAGDWQACFSRWITLVQQTLWAMNHLTSPILETLQAKLLLAHFLPVTSQSTSRSAQHKLLVEGAHILQLHRTDSPRQVESRPRDTYDMVKLEIQRRVWWSIVITDWMLSAMAGPQHGTYLLHPDQMNVQYPSNINDEDISNGYRDRPFLGAPTEMTFIIAKIKFTTIIRQLIDTANQTGVSAEELEYGQVLTFDKTFDNFYESLPRWLSSEVAASEEQRTYLATQRNFFLFGFYTRLALLHRQFLVRSYKEPYYEYSRNRCLDATRRVIHTYKTLGRALWRRMWVATTHLFIAATTLMMDYSCLRHDAQHAAERRQEVLECYRLLEGSKAQDPEVQRNLAKLHTITSEWKIAHTAPPSEHPIHGSHSQSVERLLTPRRGTEPLQSEYQTRDLNAWDIQTSTATTSSRPHHHVFSKSLNTYMDQEKSSFPALSETSIPPIEASACSTKYGNPVGAAPMSLGLLSPESLAEASAFEEISNSDIDILKWDTAINHGVDVANDFDWNSLFNALEREQPTFYF